VHDRSGRALSPKTNELGAVEHHDIREEVRSFRSDGRRRTTMFYEMWAVLFELPCSQTSRYAEAHAN